VTALLGWGIWALVVAQIGQSLGRTVVLLWKHPPRLAFIIDGPAFRDLAYFGGGFTANHHMTSSAFCNATIEKGGAGPFCRQIDGTTC